MKMKKSLLLKQKNKRIEDFYYTICTSIKWFVVGFVIFIVAKLTNIKG